MPARSVVVATLATLALALAAAPAAADNCVDDETARLRGGRPCLDVGASMGRAEVWQAPGFLDVRLSLVRVGVFGKGDGARGFGFELGSWETIGAWGDLEAVRDLGDRSAARLISLRRQVDHAGWGAYAGGDLLHRWYGSTRGFTPRLGLRVGRHDQASLVVEAALPGLFLFGSAGSQRALTADVDVGARATLTVSRRWRAEARGRLRDLVAADGHHLRDATIAIGVDVEASPRGPGRPTPAGDRMQVMTLFVGLAARRALVDEPGGQPALARTTSSTAPWQVMAWLDLDLAINTARTVW